MKTWTCSTVVSVIENEFAITYFGTVAGIIGDYMLQYDTEVTRSEFVVGPAEDSGAPLEIGKMNSYATVIHNGDTLIRGDCFFWSPCARDDASRYDMADFFSFNRLRRSVQ